MSAPSVLHEDRVRDLETFASLAGFTTSVDLYVNRIPDLVRLHCERAHLLIGDAKATESPRDSTTRQRLLSYLSCAALWSSAGYAVDVLICHDSLETRGWTALLRKLALIDGRPPTYQYSVNIDATTSVTGIGLGRPTRLSVHASAT